MEEWKLAGAMLGRIPLTYPSSNKERRKVPRGKNAGGCEKITAGTTSPYVYCTCQGSDPQVCTSWTCPMSYVHNTWAGGLGRYKLAIRSFVKDIKKNHATCIECALKAAES